MHEINIDEKGLKKMFTRIKEKIKREYYLRIMKTDPIKYNIDLMRKKGITIGENCRIFSFIKSTEPSLITIGNKVTISSDVEFCTHDNAIIKVIPGKTDVVGPITIGDNCFIGMRSIIMYGVTLGDSCVVGAGSVVTHSFPAGTVIAGNPAKRICTVEEYAEKYKEYAIDFSTISVADRKEYFINNPEKMVKR